MTENCVEAVVEAFKRLEISDVAEDHKLEADLGMDSQELVMLACELETTTGIKLSVGEIKRSMKVQDVVDVIQRKMTTNGTATSSLVETVIVEADPQSVYRALYNVSEWKNCFPNIADVEILYDDGVFQEFRLSICRKSNKIAKMRTVRRWEGNRIEFFQPEPEDFLKAHYGEWTWHPNADGTTSVTLQAEWRLSEKAADVFSSDDGATSEERVKSHLHQHMQQVMVTWKKVLEGVNA